MVHILEQKLSSGRTHAPECKLSTWTMPALETKFIGQGAYFAEVSVLGHVIQSANRLSECWDTCYEVQDKWW